MIYNVVLVSGVQQSDSVTLILTHVSILFQILFPIRLLQNIKQSSLCSTVGPCWLSILYIVYLYIYMCVCVCVYIYIYIYINPKLLIYSPPFPFGNHKFVFYICESISVL